MAVYLAPADHIDSDDVLITAQARQLRRAGSEAARAVYYLVRDLRYEGGDFEDPETYRASSVLAAGHGYCVGKAALCAALARALGIPARLRFADVPNHLASSNSTAPVTTCRPVSWRQRCPGSTPSLAITASPGSRPLAARLRAPQTQRPGW